MGDQRKRAELRDLRGKMNARTRMRNSYVLVLLAVVVLCVTVVSAAPRKEIDWDALEKAWEADDAPEELRSGADEHYDRLNTIPQALATAEGPQMVFVTLATHERLGELAGRWKEMLWNGGVDVNIYEIEESKVLIGLQKGMFIPELRRFLQQQQEVIAYDWNSKTYTRDDPVGDYTATPKNMRSKKKKHKAKKAKRSNPPISDHPMHDGL